MSTGKKPTRGAVYVDGFNLYHAIDDLKQDYLKWLDLWKLSENLAKGHANPIVKVTFCTAYFPGDTGKKARHRFYSQALELRGVTNKFGHDANEPCRCPKCDWRWDIKREKATDINLALSIYEDAADDVFDTAFILTADSDQAATMAFVRKRYPDKKMVMVVPPGRPISKHLLALADNKILLTEKHIHNAIFPLSVTDGVSIVERPQEYDPPWYVRPTPMQTV